MVQALRAVAPTRLTIVRSMSYRDVCKGKQTTKALLLKVGFEVQKLSVTE